MPGVYAPEGPVVAFVADFWGHTPALTGCITDAGSIAVIPGGQQVCAQLGLANWVGELSDDELIVVDFEQTVIDSFGSRCVPRVEAPAFAQQLLDTAGLIDWTVADNNNWTAQRPCAGPGVDPATKTLTVGGRRPKPGENVPATQPTT